MWSGEGKRPLASNANTYGKGQTVADVVETMLGPGGTFVIYTTASVDLIFDVAGGIYPSLGAIHLLSANDQHCPSGSEKITWNEQGPPGPQGAPGPSNAFYVPISSGLTVNASTTPVTIASISLLPGNYVVEGDLVILSSTPGVTYLPPDMISCELLQSGASGSELSVASADAPSDALSLSLEALLSLEQQATVNLSCYTEKINYGVEITNQGKLITSQGTGGGGGGSFGTGAGSSPYPVAYVTGPKSYLTAIRVGNLQSQS